MTSHPLLRAALLTAAALFPSIAQASFAQHREAPAFIEHMVATHGFEAQEVSAALSRARHVPDVIRLITPPKKTSARSWQNYRARFLNEQRIEGGARFWQEHGELLARASQQYGVPAEVIVAIIGVETQYGGNTGNFEALSALATLAFEYPPRAELFRKELENLLVLAREQGREPASYYGSFAGALGYPQFLPSSIRNFAVDFDGNGVIDFESDAVDAIGSVANYLAVHGWVRDAPVAQRVHLPDNVEAAPLIEAGILPSLDPLLLQARGIVPIGGDLTAAEVTFIDLPTPGARTEYWLGYRNFYAITRYNRSSFYAMSVFQLAEAIAARAGRR